VDPHRLGGRRHLRGLPALRGIAAAPVSRALAPEISVEANAGKPLLARTFAALLRWYAQPILPRDPLNNPLVNANAPQRIAAGFRIYARGLGQILFPQTLSGDYSAPQEPFRLV